MSLPGLAIIGAVELLLLMMLGSLAVMFYRIDLLSAHPHSKAGLGLKLAGLTLVACGLLLDSTTRVLLPLLAPGSPLLPKLLALETRVGWPLVVGGFFLFCLGLFHLLRTLSPQRLLMVEEELQRQKLLGRELESRSQGLELLYRNRNLELARSEEAALLAHNIAAMTLQNMNQGLIMVDAAGEVLVYNQAYLHFTGLSVEEAEQCRSFDDFVRQAHTAPTPHDPQQVVTRAREGGSYSYEVVLGTGKVYDVRQTALANGGFIRTYTDITERKQMEQQLRESRDVAESASALMTTTMQNMDQGILMVDAADRIVIFNDKVLELLRKDRLLVHQHISLEEFFRLGEVDENAVQHALRTARERERRYYELDTLDGRTLAVRQNPLEQGGWVRTYTEITEQKAVEAALRQAKSVAESSSALIELTLQHMGQGILMVDAAGRLVTWNHKLCEFMGLSQQQVASCGTFTAFMALADMPDTVRERACQLARDSNACTYELPLAGGRILQLIQNPLPEGGWVCTYSDMTARKKIEQDLQRAMVEAEASSQAKAAFLATMSHEIRTPMNGIIGMVDLLSQSRLNGEQAQVVRTIRDSGHALLTILNDVLDLSKIEAGKLQLELVEMSIRDTVEGAAATLSASAARKDILLVTYVDPDLRDRVLGDPVRIRQIIFNLLSNAIKFSSRGSEVVVRVDPVRSADQGAEQAVLFTVMDRGVGIPKRAQATLFESFIQAESSTTRRYGGTGLGLAICKRLTDMMQGSIKFSSVEGEGTTFFIDLRFRTLAADTGPDALPQRPLEGLQVVLAGYSEMQCFVATRYLQAAGAVVHPTLDMDEVPVMMQELQELVRQPDALILLDCNQGERYRRLHRQLQGLAAVLPPILLAQSSGRLMEQQMLLGGETLLEINPLRCDKLVRSVALACGRLKAEDVEHLDLEDLSDLPPPTVQEALEAGSLVLVVEDNAVNQDVIRRQLNRLGYQCELANNGREALQLWEVRRYAMVLTDCHMPELDGFDLTRAIRREEQRKARKRTPVIAITADALQGTAERCMEAGMDDYLVKPLKLKSLQELLRKWMVRRVVPLKPAGSLEASFRRQLHLRQTDEVPLLRDMVAVPVFDERAIKDELGDDPALFREILQDFHKALCSEMDELEAALEEHRLEQVFAAAHKLKSSCRTVGAQRLALLCEALEQAARSHDWPGVQAARPQLPGRLRELRDVLAGMDQSGAS